MTTAAPTTGPATTPPPTTAAPTTGPATTPPPSTAVPTSLAPTTAAPTTAPPTTPAPIAVVWPLTQWVDAGPIEVTVSIEGDILNYGLSADPIIVTLTVLGNDVYGETVVDGLIEVEITLAPADAYLGDTLIDRVRWSKIGDLDFTIDETNLAGERPVDWRGSIYDIRKLSNSVVVYGQNGVSVFRPSGIHYAMNTVYRIGVKNKGASAGDELNHFFIDILNQLWALGTNYRGTTQSKSEGLTKLDYSEYLGLMTDPIMSYDKGRKLLYICDGTYGFIYSVDSGSFGEGPVNVTGFDVQGGTSYVVSDDEIVTPKFEIKTDIFDFGTRKFKTIHSIEIGSNLTEHLYASVEYRTSNKDDFRQINWFLVNPNGRAHPKCYGLEFRFLLKSYIYEYFEIDYVKVRGHIHGFSYLDTTVERSGSAE